MKTYIDQLQALLGKSAAVFPENLYPEKTEIPAYEKPAGNVFCVHCASKNIVEIYKTTDGTVAGGCSDYVFLCKDCKLYTTVEFSWG